MTKVLLNAWIELYPVSHKICRIYFLLDDFMRLGPGGLIGFPGAVVTRNSYVLLRSLNVRWSSCVTIFVRPVR